MAGCLKVNFCAAPSSRKTTVCAGLESKLKQAQVNVDVSKEYARQYINTYGVPRDLHEQFIINENQDTRDFAVAKVTDVLLTDTPAMAPYVFGVRMLEAIRKERGEDDYSKAQYKFLEELFLKSLRKTRWFDIIFVLPPAEVVQDGTRMENDLDVQEIHLALTGFLHTNRIPYTVLEGSVDEKIDRAFRHVTTMLSGLRTKSQQALVMGITGPSWQPVMVPEPRMPNTMESMKTTEWCS